jgi:protein-tyrosine phosphatase
MLRLLKGIGFDHVVATPHMRPGFFDNQSEDLRRAYGRMLPLLSDEVGLPVTSLGSEHHFDAAVLERIRRGEGLPYRKSSNGSDGQRLGGAILIEFSDLPPNEVVQHAFFKLQLDGFVIVLAHPERYRSVWENPHVLEPLIERGVVPLLDTAALVGKYGKSARRSALELLDRGAYGAACSDAHRPADVEMVGCGIDWVRREYGDTEVRALFFDGPRALLSGRSPPTRP